MFYNYLRVSAKYISTSIKTPLFRVNIKLWIFSLEECIEKKSVLEIMK